jgi:hypothetical protein
MINAELSASSFKNLTFHQRRYRVSCCCTHSRIHRLASIMASATLGQSVSPPARRCGLRGAGGISTEARMAANIARGFCAVTIACAGGAWACLPPIPRVSRATTSSCDGSYISHVTSRIVARRPPRVHSPPERHSRQETNGCPRGQGRSARAL